MKLTKKFVAAIGLCALSACMLVTSTFAWFSMNDEVTATGMTVTAKGDQIYLQIIGEDTTNFTNGKNETSATAKYYHGMEGADDTTVDYKLLPTSVRTATGSGESATLSTYNGGTPAWVYAVGTSNTDGAASGGYTNVTSTATNGKYFLQNTFYIRLDPTAGQVTAPALRVSAVGLTTTAAGDFKKAVSVLVVCTIGSGENVVVKGDLWQFDKAVDGAENTYALKHAGGSTTLSGDTFNVTDKTCKVDVYVFFDGDNADCTLADLAAATTAATYTVDVAFTVAAVQNNG